MFVEKLAKFDAFLTKWVGPYT